jgi:hypothetical protein
VTRPRIPAGFVPGARVIRSFGPDRRQERFLTVARVTATSVVDSDGKRYYADRGTADNGLLWAAGASTAMWPATLELAEQ